MQLSNETRWKDSRHWKFGIIYFCADDPRLVPSYQLRWTLNFAHHTTYLLCVVLVLAAIVPSLAMFKAGQPHRIQEMLLLSGGLITALLLAASRVGR